MILHEIMMTWKDSIKHLSWSELKNLLLVSLKSYVTGGKLLSKYFWWLILSVVGLTYIIKNSFFVKPFWVSAYTVSIGLLWIILNYFLIFFMYAVLRPSLERKDVSYFIRYMKKFLLYNVLLLVLYFFIGIIWSFFSSIIFVLLQFKSFELIFKGILSLLSVWLIGLILLFYLDSKEGISNFFSSVMRAIKLIIYFFPFIVIFSLFMTPIELFSKSLLNFNLLSLILFQIVYFCIKFFFFSILVNYYVKIKHTHHKLFFK